MVEILRLTGIKTPTEYFARTTHWDRVFLTRAVREWQEQRHGDGGGATPRQF